MSDKKPRVVVDTNVLVSGFIVPKGYSYKLIRLWLDGRIVLVTSHSLRLEYTHVLSRSKFAVKYGLTAEQVELRMRFLESGSMDVSPAESLPLPIRDPKDEKVLACALGGKADYLVTGDRDLLVLSDDPRIKPLRILTVRELVSLFVS